MTHINTLAAQAGYSPQDGAPRVAPIVASTTYHHADPDKLADLFNLDVAGHLYSRISNPSVGVLEEKVAAMEGGIGAVGVSSGQSATMLTILAVAQAGDHIIALASLYGGTYTLLTATLARLGIECTFVPNDASDDEFAAAVRPTTRLVFAETLPNPALDVTDIERVAALAHRHGLPLAIDNSLATAALCRPLDFGADIVTHSSTKYLDGHATSVGGLIVDSGRFAWTAERHPLLVEPDAAYHGLSWTGKFGPAAFLARVRAGLVRDTGAVMAPFNAFLTTVGVETVALRMERHSSNALALARHLQGHDKVAWVRYPGLDGFPTVERTRKYMPNGASGVLTFGVRGGHDAAKAFLGGIDLIKLVTHIADLRSCAIHPASTTHRQLTDDEQAAAGVTPDLIRLSVGIEHIDDLIADVDQALAGI